MEYNTRLAIITLISALGLVIAMMVVEPITVQAISWHAIGPQQTHVCSHTAHGPVC